MFGHEEEWDAEHGGCTRNGAGVDNREERSRKKYHGGSTSKNEGARMVASRAAGTAPVTPASSGQRARDTMEGVCRGARGAESAGGRRERRERRAGAAASRTAGTVPIIPSSAGEGGRSTPEEVQIKLGGGGSGGSQWAGTAALRTARKPPTSAASAAQGGHNPIEEMRWGAQGADWAGRRRERRRPRGGKSSIAHGEEAAQNPGENSARRAQPNRGDMLRRTAAGASGARGREWRRRAAVRSAAGRGGDVLERKREAEQARERQDSVYAIAAESDVLKVHRDCQEVQSSAKNSRTAHAPIFRVGAFRGWYGAGIVRLILDGGATGANNQGGPHSQHTATRHAAPGGSERATRCGGSRRVVPGGRKKIGGKGVDTDTEFERPGFRRGRFGHRRTRGWPRIMLTWVWTRAGERQEVYGASRRHRELRDSRAEKLRGGEGRKKGDVVTRHHSVNAACAARATGIVTAAA
ncbi:hypothetical protein C8R47DRAFT_1065462 [Mycena vitilis]|nr:hypothetical protein C8R47DRAFT_1065462 [Mycena vitilis]